MLFVKKSASFCTGRAEFNPSLSLSLSLACSLSLSLFLSLSLKVEEAFFFKSNNTNKSVQGRRFRKSPIDLILHL